MLSTSNARNATHHRRLFCFPPSKEKQSRRLKIEAASSDDSSFLVCCYEVVLVVEIGFNSYLVLGVECIIVN